MESLLKIILVMGATATGKSEYAIELAHQLNGEIINADAMQLYRGLSIGTAKLPKTERGGIPHHLLDVAEIHDPIDVFRYIKLAEQSISEVIQRGKTPILCGGTGYYIKSLVYGLDELPGDPALRSQLDTEYDSDSGETELRRLILRDAPADLERWPVNRRKLIRAREVFLLTEKPMSEQLSDTLTPRYKVKAFNLLRDRGELRQRIFQRTAAMLANGWVDEAKIAIAKGLLETPTAKQAIGYVILSDFLNGKISLSEAEERIATRTWQYARRQMTWFAAQPPPSTVITRR